MIYISEVQEFINRRIIYITSYYINNTSIYKFLHFLFLVPIEIKNKR